MTIVAWGAFRELNSEGAKPSSSGGFSGIIPEATHGPYDDEHFARRASIAERGR
jgi:hypothetical protein